jgi:hypothetical protein
MRNLILCLLFFFCGPGFAEIDDVLRPTVPAAMPKTQLDVWQQTLQDCEAPVNGLAPLVEQLRIGEPQTCERALDLGRQLQCVVTRLPASPKARERFSDLGLLTFQGCLHPLAAGLVSGQLGNPREMALELRQCVMQLDNSAVGPVAPQPWWRRFFPAKAVPLPLASATPSHLPLPNSPSWPSCSDVNSLKAVSAPAAPGQGAITAPAAPTVPDAALQRLRLKTPATGVTHDA